MHVKRKINLSFFIIVSLFNFLFQNWLFKPPMEVIFIVVGVVILVQLMLLLGVSFLFSEVKSWIKKLCTLLLPLKFLILALTGHYIVNNYLHYTLFFVVFYTFQLIILVISIKRD